MAVLCYGPRLNHAADVGTSKFVFVGFGGFALVTNSKAVSSKVVDDIGSTVNGPEITGHRAWSKKDPNARQSTKYG